MPNNWKTYKLFDFMDINPRMKFDSGKQYSFVEMKDLDPSSRKVLPSNYKKLKGGAKFQNGDTLFARITPCLENGKICQVQGLKDNIGFGSTEFLVFRGKENVSDSDFVYYLSRDPFVKQFAEQNMIGTSGRQRVAKEAFINLELNLPPLPEQKAIANILSAIDDKIENNLAINKTLEDMAMALYKHWFVDFGPFQDEEFVDSELGRIPKGWEVKKISEVFEVRDGTHNSPKRKEKGYYLITSKHLKDNQIDYSSAYKISREDFDKVNNRSLVEKGDILMTMIGTVGNFFFVNHNPDYAIKNIGLFKTSQAPELQYYVYSFFKSKLCQDYIKAQMSGSTQQYITLKTLRNFPIVFPDDLVIEKYSKVVKNNFEKIDTNIKENQSLTQLRDSLLPKLISGEIRLKEFKEQIQTVL